VAYHILQSGVTCRLPKTPRSKCFRAGLLVNTNWDRFVLPAPRSLVNHYFDVSHSCRCTFVCATYHLNAQETIDSQSEYGDDTRSMASAVSAADLNTLGDVSPDAL
jgi:hypothetical protein